MEDLVDMITSDGSAIEISDKIKEVLFAKCADKINDIRPEISNSVFSFEDNNS